MKFLLSFVLLAGVSAQAQNSAGNGGDALRKLFQQAQLVAAQLSEEILPCELKPNVAPKVREWILANHAMLSHDILQTQQKWIVDLQGTCAYTSLNLGANVYLSYNECRDSTHTMDDAVFTLIHESVHHFGITEEGFADQVARAILEADELPSCPDAGTPWDDNYCSEDPITKPEVLMLFPPASTDVLYKDLNVETKIRRCQEITGCEPWKREGVLRNTKNTILKNVLSGFQISSGNIIRFELFATLTNHQYSYDWEKPHFSLNDPANSYIYFAPNASAENYTWLTFSGKVSRHCTKLEGTGRFNFQNGVYDEFKAVLYSRY